MNFLTLVESKRDGRPLSTTEIRWLVREFTRHRVPDYQMSAFLMAVYFRGLDVEETRALTLAMRDSGDILKLPRDSRPVVDKHSTGGIGDKVSLPLAPLLACLGFRVPMISGRGLGITGGTLDKLDSIPGFQTRLPTRRIVAIVQKVGCVICGQSEHMVPADRSLYALRDATATVPSIPLIVASVLSKKLAENLDALLLDVKFGSAAFMQNRRQARQLARTMVALGRECGVNTRALLSDMNTPLGRSAGNWLEVMETVAVLEPETTPVTAARHPADLRRLVIECAAHLLVQTRKSRSLAHARKRALHCLNSGDPRRKWDEMVVAQGGHMAGFNRKLRLDHTAAAVLELKSERDGFVSRCDSRIIGEVIRDLGGGRLTKESAIDHSVGVDRLAKPGDRIGRGGVLVRVHARSDSEAHAAVGRLRSAFDVAARPGRQSDLIPEVVGTR